MIRFLTALGTEPVSTAASIEEEKQAILNSGSVQRAMLLEINALKVASFEKDLAIQKAHDDVIGELKHLEKTRMWASSKIFQLYWMSDKTLDEVANDIGISKSTTFLAVKRIRKYLKEVINNPYNEN